MAARVLIVDDEPYILRILAFKLRRAGYVALEATNADDAMEILTGSPPACLILDVSLGSSVTGFHFAERLRDDPRYCRIPVVFLTARSLPSELRRGKELGAAAYVTKPFSLQQVLEEVARLVPPPDGPSAQPLPR
jgi:two-component system OmpR family response regulator